MTIQEVASILRMGKTNTYKLVKRKDFPKVTIGKKILVKEEDLNNYLTKYLKNKITLWSGCGRNCGRKI